MNRNQILSDIEAKRQEAYRNADTGWQDGTLSQWERDAIKRDADNQARADVQILNSYS